MEKSSDFPFTSLEKQREVNGKSLDFSMSDDPFQTSSHSKNTLMEGVWMNSSILKMMEGALEKRDMISLKKIPFAQETHKHNARKQKEVI